MEGGDVNEQVDLSVLEATTRLMLDPPASEYSAATHRTTLALVARIRELEEKLLGIAEVSEEEGWSDYAAELRALVEKGTVIP